MVTYVIFVKFRWYNGLWFSPTFLLHAIVAGGCRHSQSAKCRSPQFHVGLFICYFEHSTWGMCYSYCYIVDCLCATWLCVQPNCNRRLSVVYWDRFPMSMTLQTNFMEHISSWLADVSSPGQITWKCISIFTVTCHWTLCWARWIQSIFSHLFGLKVLNYCSHIYF
jgi:hypothetical protein